MECFIEILQLIELLVLSGAQSRDFLNRSNVRVASKDVLLVKLKGMIQWSGILKGNATRLFDLFLMKGCLF